MPSWRSSLSGAEVVLARALPVAVQDAELESGLGLAQEVALVREVADEGGEEPGGGLADAERGDVRGLDDDDLEVERAASAFPEAREVDRRQPAGGATSDDDDLLDAGVHGGV